MIGNNWGKAVVWTVAGLMLAGVIWITFLIVNRPELPVIDKAETFVLEDTEKANYDSNNQKVKLLAFFYTNCPDICPLTMIDFASLQSRLKKEGLFGNKVELLVITLDPEVDSMEIVKKYAQNFQADPTGWKFLRGSMSETKEIADLYHMKFQKVSGGAIAHNTTMYLIDKDNQIRGLYDMANTQEKVDIEAILDSIHILVEE
jgi:protein SCO1